MSIYEYCVWVGGGGVIVILVLFKLLSQIYSNIFYHDVNYRVGKMLAFMSKVHAGGIYRRLLVFTGVYWNLPAFTDIAGFLLLFLVLAQN